MAYPFSKSAFTSEPQTPPHVKGITSPRTSMASTMTRSTKSYIYFALLGGIALLFIIKSNFGREVGHSDQVPFSRDRVENYFNHFEGHQDCGITSKDLYIPPTIQGDAKSQHLPFCKNRAALLNAMSGGGREGFDVQFAPRGCHYRWFSTAEICMILDRFDGVVFIGDTMLQHIYTAFNILLRQNMALGGLQQWRMSDSERGACRCENQFVKNECTKFAVTSSEEVKKNDGSSGYSSPYYCDRTPLVLLPVMGSPAPEDMHSTFTSLLARDPSSYKPIPVIHSLSLSISLSWPTATASMDEWLMLADASARSTPFLWLGPVAAGHLKPPGQILSQGNNALWHYTVEMTKEAKSREMDSLGMYNLTLQASSWDGSNYGESIALVQAMMIINWLSRLETS